MLIYGRWDYVPALGFPVAVHHAKQENTKLILWLQFSTYESVLAKATGVPRSFDGWVTIRSGTLRSGHGRRGVPWDATRPR